MPKHRTLKDVAIHLNRSSRHATIIYLSAAE